MDWYLWFNLNCSLMWNGTSKMQSWIKKNFTSWNVIYMYNVWYCQYRYIVTPLILIIIFLISCRVAVLGSSLSLIWSECRYGALHTNYLFKTCNKESWEMKYRKYNLNQGSKTITLCLCVQWKSGAGEMWCGCSSLSVLSETSDHSVVTHLCAVCVCHPPS